MDYEIGLLGVYEDKLILFQYNNLFDGFIFNDLEVFDHTDLELITIGTEKQGEILNSKELFNNYSTTNILEKVYFFLDENTGLYKVFYKSMYISYSYNDKPSISLRKSSYTKNEWELLCKLFNIPNNVSSFDTELDNIQTFID